MWRDQDPAPGFDPVLGSLPGDPAGGVYPSPGQQNALPPPPGPPPPGTPLEALGCGICSATPVGEFHFTQQTGALITVIRDPHGGRLCRSCGLWTGRRVQNRSLAFGWFGIVAFFLNLGTIMKNAQTLRRVAALPEPTTPNQLTRRLGFSALLRPGLLVPFAVLAFVGYGVFDAVQNPSTSVDQISVGQCIDAPPEEESFTRFTIRPCDEPHEMEVFATSKLSSQLRTEERVVDYCIEEFESYVGGTFFESDLNLTFTGPERLSTSSSGESVHCLLFAMDGDLIVGSQRGTG